MKKNVFCLGEAWATIGIDRGLGDVRVIWARRVRLVCCSSARQSHALDRRHCGLARHFKTDPSETVALCFGYAKTPC
jgi:hypothetical protein